MSEEQPVAAKERVKARNRKADGNYPVHLTPEQILIARRIIDNRWVFMKSHPMPEDKPEELEALLHVCDIFYHAYQQYCP
jgi:hypothetical protein